MSTFGSSCQDLTLLRKLSARFGRQTLHHYVIIFLFRATVSFYAFEQYQ